MVVWERIENGGRGGEDVTSRVRGGLQGGMGERYFTAFPVVVIVSCPCLTPLVLISRLARPISTELRPLTTMTSRQ